jgi:carbon monoxide dehydrogenase subunit G
MIEHQLAVTLKQAPERAFDFFVDFRNEPAWNPDCLIVEKTSDGPIAIGTTFTGKMKRFGPSESEIVALERPRHCSVVDRSRGAQGTFDFRFTPHDGGTRIDVTVQMRPRGPMRLLQPLLAPMVRRMLADLPDKMRRGIDATDTARGHATVA